MKNLRLFSVLIVLICSFQAQLIFAQTSTTAERPKFTAGDTWTYRVLDGWSGNEQKQLQDTFTGVEAERLMFQRIDKSNNASSNFKFDADVNNCRSMKGSNDLVCAGSYKFPMSVGQKISYEKLPFESGFGYSNAECTIKTAEKLTVPAGSFDTFKIDCSGYWQRVLEGNASGSLKFTIWYAPSAKRAVKFTEETTWNSKVQDKKTTELVSFKIQ